MFSNNFCHPVSFTVSVVGVYLDMSNYYNLISFNTAVSDKLGFCIPEYNRNIIGIRFPDTGFRFPFYHQIECAYQLSVGCVTGFWVVFQATE